MSENDRLPEEILRRMRARNDLLQDYLHSYEGRLGLQRLIRGIARTAARFRGGEEEARKDVDEADGR